MRSLLNPKWLFIVNTLPIIVLFFLFYGEFTIIQSLLDEENIRYWKNFGAALATLACINFVYAAYLVIQHKRVSLYYSLIGLVSYILFIYLFSYYSDKILPLSIPAWMFDGNLVLYAGTFLMPTLAYSMFVLVTHFTPDTKDHKAGKNFIIAIAIPIAWYLFIQIILPLWRLTDYQFNSHVIIVIVITGTLAFLFFLIRGLFILTTKKAASLKKYDLAWKIPITIVMPLLGLAVNNGHLFNYFQSGGSGVFGDFNSYWFYVLAVINGLFICLPNIEHNTYRIGLFIGRSITFAYTFYFFLVFLPFLPLSIFAIIIFGVGFLMLTPLLLFVLHINELSKDIDYLKQHISTNLIRTISIMGILVIPGCITQTYLQDRKTLNQALEYLYSPDYARNYTINKASLVKTIHTVQSHKENNQGGIWGTQQPYLSTFFNWLVLDNLTLSDTKINTIERVFWGHTSFELRPENEVATDVKLTTVSANSVYDTSQHAWKSWVDLELSNKSSNLFSEYHTAFELPEGTWISDYYLYVGDKKEMGILAEKKSAMWVFSNIRNINRDPGLLYYLAGNKVGFRVFPFDSGEVRKTGFELLHKDPIRFTIDGKTVILGESENRKETLTENENMVYVPASQKQKLTRVTRQPYFHFIVNASKRENIKPFISRIETLAKTQADLARNAQISFVNTYASSTSINKNWQQQFEEQSFEGGFYAERAIKSALFHAYKEHNSSYPVFVIVTDSLQNAVLGKSFSEWRFCFPENNLFYNLEENGMLSPHSLITDPYQTLTSRTDSSTNLAAYEYRLKDGSARYLPDNNEASIILKTDLFNMNETSIKEKDWNSALLMQGKLVSQVLHPETATKEWLDLVKYSFMSRVMTPLTSYIVVENEAQKAILKKKQEQVLAGNKSLDLDEDSQRMSEPGLFILAIFLGLIFWFKEKKAQTLIEKGSKE